MDNILIEQKEGLFNALIEQTEAIFKKCELIITGYINIWIGKRVQNQTVGRFE